MKNALENFKLYLSNIISMDDTLFKLSLDFLEVIKIKKNDYFIRNDEYCNQIGFINSGIFRTFYLKEGKEVNTCFCKENEIVSSFESFIHNTVSKENIQALENSEIVTLSSDGLKKLCQLDSKWLLLRNLVVEKECMRLTDRVQTLSFETALKKYRSLIENQPEIIQRIEIQHIASYIGVSRETLSRVRSKIATM